MSPELQKQLNALLDQYTVEVKAAKLKESTEITYLKHANNFIRWCNGEFSPGEKKSK